MKLLTRVPTEKDVGIDYGCQILSMGSCFAEHMGQKLKEGKFITEQNPFGILFNPVSVFDALERIISKKKFEGNELFQLEGIWHSWMHHSSYSNMDKTQCLEQINTSISSANKVLHNAQYLILTFGSAYAYWHKEKRKFIGNCHKIPQVQFEKKRLGIDDIVFRFKEIYQQIKLVNPQIKIITTVSPVRHIKDGIVENQRSKAVLLLAIEKMCCEDNVSYFPSYEIMMDELRDYRFYNADMIHPSTVAIDYIWEKFRDVYFSHPTEGKYQEAMKLVRGFQHIILHQGSQEHRNFVQQHIKKAEEFMVNNAVDFKAEINRMRGQLELF